MRPGAKSETGEKRYSPFFPNLGYSWRRWNRVSRAVDVVKTNREHSAILCSFRSFNRLAFVKNSWRISSDNFFAFSAFRA